MVSIEITVFARFKETFGGLRKLEISEDKCRDFSVKDALIKLCSETEGGYEVLFDSDEEILDSVLLMHNKKRISAGDADDIIIQDGDGIVLYPPVSGG